MPTKMKNRIPESPVVEIQQLLTIDQVAELLNVSRVTVYDMVHNEGLPVVLLRRRIRVRPYSLQQWLTTRETNKLERVYHGSR